MSENAMEEKFDVVGLCGKYALFANFRIDCSTIPTGWHCYDIRGSDDCGKLATLEPKVIINHAGSVLSPQPVPFPDGQDYLDISDEISFTEYHDITLAQFCDLYGIDFPEIPTKYVMRPASPDEAGLFYAMPPEQDAELGCIGHIRIDFGRGGDGFYHTWNPRGPEELNTQEFKDELRKSVLKDFSSMTGYCSSHGGEISGGWVQNYGYIVETENYCYCLWCNPVSGDYQAYLTAFDLRAQEMDQTGEERYEEPVPLELHSLADLKWAIKPGTELMTTYHAKHPELVGLVRVVTEVHTNAFFTVVKDQPDHKYSDCNYGRGFRSDFEKASNYRFDGTTITVLDARKGDGTVLYEFEVYEQEMKMEVQEENEEAFIMTMGGM